MKSRALYHLMQVTAAKLREVGAEAPLAAIAETLAVSHGKGTYRFEWTADGERRAIDLPDDRFFFYPRGPGTVGVDLRSRNWCAALDAWADIARLSGLTVDTTAARAELGFHYEPATATHPLAQDRLLVVLIAGLAALPAGAAAAGAAGLSALALAVLLDGLDDGRREPGLLGLAIAAMGVVGAILLLGQGNALAATLLPLAGATWLERRRGSSWPLWAVGGAASSLPAFLSATAPVGSILTAVGVLGLAMMPGRLGWSRCVAWIAAALPGILAAAWTAQPASNAVSGPGYAAALLLLAVALVWWMHGTLARVMPWWSLVAVGGSALVMPATMPGTLGFAVVAAMGLAQRMRPRPPVAIGHDRTMICPVCGAGGLVPRDDYRSCGTCGHEILACATDQQFMVNDRIEGADVSRPDITVRFQTSVAAKVAPSGGMLIDVGCGIGKFLWHSRERFQRVVGVEVSPASIAFARDTLGLRVHSTIGEDLAGAADLITFWHSLEHIPTAALDATLAGVSMALAPHGRVIVSVPNARSIQALLFGRNYAFYDVPHHLHQFSRESLLRLMARHGFKPVDQVHGYVYAAFGYAQGLLNLFNPIHNYLYYSRKRGADYGLSRGARLGLAALNGLLLIPCLPLAAVAAAAEAPARQRHAALTVVFVKCPDGSGKGS